MPPSSLSRHALLTLALLTGLATGACLDRSAEVGDGVLRVAVEAGPSHLDPRLALDQASSRACQLIHAGLVTRDAELQVVPDLAESWDVAEDGLTYRFRLRAGLRFHDGRPLTARDVVRTFESVLDDDPDNPYGIKRGDLEQVVSVAALDPLEVELRLAEPNAPLLGNLCFFGILPDGGGPDTDSAPVGAGPFRLTSHRTGVELVLTRHEHHHEGPPPLNGVTLRVLPDASSRVSALRAGEVDVVVNDLPSELVDTFRDDMDFELLVRPGVNYAYVIFNVEDPLLADARVRRAIAHAIDRAALVQYLLSGRARPARSMMSEASWAFDPALPDIAHDPEASRRLLDEAGLPDPPGAEPRFRLEMKSSNSTFALRQAQVLTDALADVGIEVSLRSFEWGTYYQDLRRGNFQLTSGRWIGIMDPDVYRLRFHSEQTPDAGGLNRGRYANAEVDALVDQGLRAASQEERRRIYARVQAILQEELPYVSLYHLDNFAVVRRGVAGVVVNPAGDFHLLRLARVE